MRFPGESSRVTIFSVRLELSLRCSAVRDPSILDLSRFFLIDRKSLFLRHEHSPAGPGLKERFHGGNGS